MNKTKTFWAVVTALSAVCYTFAAKDELREKNNEISELELVNTELKSANNELTYEINSLKRLNK